MVNNLMENSNTSSKSKSSKSNRKSILFPVSVASVLGFHTSCAEKQVSSNLPVDTNVQANYSKDDESLPSVTDLLNEETNPTVSESLDLGKEAKTIVKETETELNRDGNDSTPGMADLRKIRINDISKELRNLSRDKSYITIDGYKYQITNKDQSFLDGNYYNKDNDIFYIVTDNGNKILQYSDFWGFSKIYNKEKNIAYGKDEKIDLFIGQFGKIIREDVQKDSGLTSYYNYEYDKMLGHYDFGIGTLDGQIKKMYGDSSSCGFEGFGIFNLNNGTVLKGKFTFNFDEFNIEIYGTGEIEYENKEVETGTWEQNLYYKIFNE